MSPSNNSTSGVDSGAAAAVIPIAPSAPEATVDTYVTTLASAQTSGLVSNVFRIRDTRGIVPLFLLLEGEWDSLETLFSMAQEYIRLAGYAIIQGLRGERRVNKGGRWTKYLICKHNGEYNGQGL